MRSARVKRLSSRARVSVSIRAGQVTQERLILQADQPNRARTDRAS
jgi:hypothetical protein